MESDKYFTQDYHIGRQTTNNRAVRTKLRQSLRSFISNRPFYCFSYINNGSYLQKGIFADLYYCHREIYSVHLFANVPSYFPFEANPIDVTVENFS